MGVVLVSWGGTPASVDGQVPAAPPEFAAESLVAFVGVHVIPMDRDTVLANHTVVVSGGRIAASGPAGELPVPPGALRIAGEGRWLLPGLVDAHFHLTIHRGINEAVLLLALASGTTRVLELGGDTLSLRLRAEVAAGELPGPSMHVAGPHLRDSAMTREEGIAFVDRHQAAGYDLIKIYNQASKEGFRGVMLRARELGVPTIGHVPRSMDLEGTLGGGQRGIAHLEEYLYTYFGVRLSDSTQLAGSRLDADAIPYLAGITRAAEAWVTPTLVTFEGILALSRDLRTELGKPEIGYVPKLFYDALWAPGVNAYEDRFTHPRQRDNLAVALAFQRRMVGAFHRAGVPLLAGTDALVAAVVPGFAMHEELRNLVDAGLTPYEALGAATRNAAEFMRMADEFGTVEVGKSADLLLLTANPLADIGNSDRIVGVMARGRWLPEPQLRIALERLRAEGPQPSGSRE